MLSIAQLAERFHGKEEVTSSSLVGSSRHGPLVKRFNTPAFHAGMQGFESPTGHQG